MEKKKVINFEEGIDRFVGSRKMYMKYVHRFQELNDYDDLVNAMQQDDCTIAFEMAHKLKGTTGNLSFDAMYEVTCELTELLRSNAFEQAKLYFPKVEAEYKNLMNEINQLEEK